MLVKVKNWLKKSVFGSQVFLVFGEWLKNNWYWILIIFVIIIGAFLGIENHIKDLSNAQTFNNVFTPIISLLGFLGVASTVIIMNNQNKETRSLDLYNYYQNKINQFYSGII